MFVSIHIATMGLLLPSPSTPPTNILQPGATLTGPVPVMSRYVMSDCLGIGRAATISATQPRKGGTQPVMAVNLYDPCDDYDPYEDDAVECDYECYPIGDNVACETCELNEDFSQYYGRAIWMCSG